MDIDGSSFLPTLDSFQFHVVSTSTPKRSTTTKSFHVQPLSSTLLIPNNTSCKQLDLSVSAITLVQKSSLISYKKVHRLHRHRRTHVHPSTIIKRIELKYLLYSTRNMKQSKHRQYTDGEMKIYVV